MIILVHRLRGGTADRFPSFSTAYSAPSTINRPPFPFKKTSPRKSSRVSLYTPQAFSLQLFAALPNWKLVWIALEIDGAPSSTARQHGVGCIGSFTWWSRARGRRPVRLVWRCDRRNSSSCGEAGAALSLASAWPVVRACASRGRDQSLCFRSMSTVLT